MNDEYALLYFEINLISFILIAIILHKTKGLSKMMAQRNFVMSIVAEMVFFASDTLYVLINSGVLRFGSFDDTAKLICKEIYFFATAAMCFFWFIYFELWRGSFFVKDKKTVLWTSFLLWVMGIMLIINLFTGFLFYIDKEGAYHRGPLFILTYIIAYVYVVVAFIRTVRCLTDKTYTGDRHTLILLTLFPLAPGAAGLLQFIYPRLPVACGVLALTTLILYLTWIDQLIALDPLTKLNNRKQLNHYYELWLRSHGEGESLNLLMIDANKFKSINDTYGHLQGDKALKNIAESLRRGCKSLPKRANIARYGGDEFAVLFESGDPDDTELLKNSITDSLKTINEDTKIPFPLTISIGAASTDGSDSLKDLIRRADEAMYEAKKKIRQNPKNDK